MTSSIGYLLESDKGRSVFVVLFTFYRDDACDDESINNFQNAISEILLGSSLPLGVTDKLRAVYDNVMQGQESYSQALEQIASDFSDNREVLFFIVRIVLRISQDAGIVCKQDKERINELMQVFDFSALELDRLTNQESELLSFVTEGDYRQLSELSQHYATLGCLPEDTDRQLQKMYRKLAKKYHPDRTAALELSQEAEPGLRSRFEQIQLAYETIRKSRARA